MHNRTFFALAAAFAASAAAQPPARPDPADPKAAAPARPYESAFRDYKPYIDPEIARWRESNEEAGRLGGHLGHLPRDKGTAARPAAGPAPSGGHGAHK